MLYERQFWQKANNGHETLSPSKKIRLIFDLPVTIILCAKSSSKGTLVGERSIRFNGFMAISRKRKS